VSIGVSYNKTFAKLGSDMKKPDAVTVITEDNYKHRIWPLPAVDLLFVGRATALKLYKRYGIATIGDLANCDVSYLHNLLGKPGVIIHRYANGLDLSEVRKIDEGPPVKSIGNSTTTPRDLRTLQDVHLTTLMLAESVAARLRECGLKCTTVQVSMRTNDMQWVERQAKLKKPTFLSDEISALAMEIFKTKYKFSAPIRTLGVRGSGLVPANRPEQLSLFDDVERIEKMENLEKTIDVLRGRYGFHSVKRANMLLDRELTNESPKDEHFNPFGLM
jgi:DNA polymerase-4